MHVFLWACIRPMVSEVLGIRAVGRGSALLTDFCTASSSLSTRPRHLARVPVAASPREVLVSPCRGHDKAAFASQSFLNSWHAPRASIADEGLTRYGRNASVSRASGIDGLSIRLCSL
jgi:hypothetical protein